MQEGFEVVDGSAIQKKSFKIFVGLQGFQQSLRRRSQPSIYGSTDIGREPLKDGQRERKEGSLLQKQFP